MVKKIVSLLMIVSMILSLSPSVFAQDGELSGNGGIQLMAATGSDTLTDIQINGTTIPGFTPYRQMYYYTKKVNETVTADSFNIVADGTVSKVTEAVTEKGSNYSFSITASDSSVKEYTVCVREKGVHSDETTQKARLTAYKRLNTASGAQQATVGKDSKSNDLTYVNSLKVNGSDQLDANYYVALQFDITNIKTINNRVNLVTYASINNTSSIGYLGAYAVDSEAVLTDGVAQTYTPDKFGYEIGRVLVDGKDDDGQSTSADVGRSAAHKIDVTDYILNRIENGDKTVTILLRALKLSASGETAVRINYGDHNKTNRLAALEFVPQDIELTSLKVNGSNITLNDGQYTYIVNNLTKGSTPVVDATPGANVTITSIDVPAVPGVAKIKLTDDITGNIKEYKVNMIDSDYKGTTSTRFTGGTELGSTGISTVGRFEAKSGLVYFRNFATYVRDEAYISFNIDDLLAVNTTDKLQLKLNITATGTAIGGTLQVTGVETEKWDHYTNSIEIPLTDNNYVYEPAEKIAASSTYKIDVKTYVNALIERGEKTATFIVRVKADGSERQRCTLLLGDSAPTLTVEEISTELTDIKVDGVSVADFSSSKLTYTYYMADAFVGIPAITATKKDADAFQYIELPDVIPGTAIVEVSNPAGKSTTYTIKLKYESSKTNPTTYISLPYVTYKNAANDEVIKTLTSGVKVRAELNLKNLKNEGNITFVTALYNDGFLVDKISKKKTGSETMLVNTLDVALTDVSKATVKSFILTDYENGQNVINCAQLNSQDNFIKSLTMSGYDFTEFDPDVTSYTINVPASVLNYPEFLSIPRASGTRIETVVPVYLSGAVTLKATADNGDEKIYTVNINRANAKITNATMAYPKLDGVNKKITIIENIANPVYNPVPSNPPTEGKNQGTDFNKEYAMANCQNPVVFLTDRGNYWIAQMDERFNGASLVALPFDGIKPGDNTLMADYTAKTGFIEFDINRSATVYVFHANAAVPSWATSEGFTAVTDLAPSYVFEGATDGSVNMTAMATAYSKYYAVDEWSEEPVTVSLGSISGHQYWWIIVVFDK